MKLKTSYFNPTVLRKDITRFAPVWGLYTLFMLMTVFLLWDTQSTAARFANNAVELLMPMGIVNFAYAGLCGLLLFGDLFTPRMCNMLHAMPMRREGWFLTHCASGLLFCLIPNAVGAVIAALLLQEYYYMALIWLGLMLLQYLFFFGAAVFAAMCAGNRLGAAAVYGIFNFLSVLVAWLAKRFYEPLLFGIETDFSRYAYYSPVVAFSQFNYVITGYGKPMGFWFDGFLGEQWRYLFISAGVGIVLLTLAMAIYRSRKLESAGDFIAFRWVSPVFLCLYTLCAGALLYEVAGLFGESAQYVFLVLGFAIGFFTGRMLLDRTVKVFRPKVLLAFAVLVIAFFGSLLVTRLDPLGITYAVPAPEKVDSVTIAGTPYYHYNYDGFVLEDEEDIRAIREMHEKLAGERVSQPKEPYIHLYLEYTLKSGETLRRCYPVAVNSEEGKTLDRYFSSWQCVFQTEDWEAFKKSVGKIYSEDLLPKEAHEELLEALYRDCAAGNMSQAWAFHQKEDAKYWVEISTYSEDKTQTDYLSLQIYDSCTNTIAVLNKYVKVQVKYY